MSSSFEAYQEHLAGRTPDLFGTHVDLLIKGQVKGYSKKDGTYVKPHSRIGSPVALNPIPHPRPGEKGEAVLVKTPHHPSAASTWHHPDAVATFVPDGDHPRSVNGIPLSSWDDHPKTVEGWEYVDGVNDDLDEPPFHLPPGKKAAAGVVVREPDGRIWLVHPTNQFGGYDCTFPKGTVEPELSLQASALKECWEEAGLKVRITGFLGDFARTTSVARMYLAERTGGNPVDAGWESQAVSLCPVDKLTDLLNMAPDHAVVDALAIGQK